MLVSHVNMRQLDKTSLMHKVENLTCVTQDLQLLTFNGVILRERFIIANISCPLLALGHIVRAGWEIQHFSDGVFLVKNGKFVNVSFKRNSLCVKGSIRMISEDDCLSPTSTAPEPKTLRAIHLQPVLRRLLPGCAASLSIVVTLKLVCAVIQNHHLFLCLKQFEKHVQR